jgi:hypothetical protein
MNTRMFKEFACVLARGAGFIAISGAIVAASMVAGYYVLGDPNWGFAVLMLGYVLYMAWGIAEIRLERRDREQQRLVDTLSREESH